MEQRDSSALEIMRRELGAHPKLRQLQREAILLLEETVGESAGFEVRQLLTAACGIPGAMLGPCGEREIPEEESRRPPLLPGDHPPVPGQHQAGRGAGF